MNVQFTKEIQMTKNYDNIVFQLILPFKSSPYFKCPHNSSSNTNTYYSSRCSFVTGLLKGVPPNSRTSSSPSVSPVQALPCLCPCLQPHGAANARAQKVSSRACPLPVSPEARPWEATAGWEGGQRDSPL